MSEKTKKPKKKVIKQPKKPIVQPFDRPFPVPPGGCPGGYYDNGSGMCILDS